MKNLKKEHLINLKIVINGLIILLFLSCNGVIKNDPYYKLSISENLSVGTNEYGEFLYDSYLDTIKLKQTDFRSIRLFLGVFPKDLSITELKNEKLDTFVKIDEKSNKIPFVLNFNKKGKFTVCGYIEDKVFLNNHLDSGKTRIITNESKVSGKVKFIKK